jgi:chaperonin GroES
MTNPSGILPVEYKILIQPIEVEEKTKGGIIIPDETKDRDQFAQMKGILVAVSPFAFTYEDWKGSEDSRPKPGDTVLFAKYAGAVVDGKDGKKYRLVNDKDVCAVLG